MTQKRRPWPPKRKAQQAKNIRKTRPWEHTTGPKTASGKAASSLNALKHGLRSETVQMLRKVLRAQKEWVNRIKHAGNL